MSKKPYVGWTLDDGERIALIKRFRPAYQAVVADHVTLGPADDHPLPDPAIGRIIGEADDGAGVQALVVEIDGGTDRPDGSTWHITWSLGPERKARESNDVIAKQGWRTIRQPCEVTLTPKRWEP